MKVIVTGAASGIGRATALALAASSDHTEVALTLGDRSAEGLEQVRSEAADLGARVSIWTGDLADPFPAREECRAAPIELGKGTSGEHCERGRTGAAAECGPDHTNSA